MIQTKRDSLEKFIQQQMEGPGACNNQYYCLGEQNNEEEVVNTTPGSLYSTAILFPDRKNADNPEEDQNPSISYTSEALETDPELGTNEDGSEYDDERRSGDSDEDLYSLSQRFPRAIGISCCLDKKGEPILSSDLTVTISGRYYTRVNKDEYCKIVIKIEDQNGFEKFFNLYKQQLEPYFTIIEGGIHLSKDITKEIRDIKNNILTINQELCKSIAKNIDGSEDDIYLGIRENYRYLKSYKERLWSEVKYIKNNTYITEEVLTTINERIQKIESYETYLSYLEDAVNICNTRGFGFWKSHTFSKVVDLNRINLNKEGRKTIVTSKTYGQLNLTFDGDEGTPDLLRQLSIRLQITKPTHTTSNKVYLKVQLENTSSPFEETNNAYFSIVSEKVNERSFFGVQIKIESPYLTEYQERNSINQQEDVEHLNYLYRSIKDYAVGHMCSVNWKVTDSEKWVSTEFIPSYETPDVEAIPRNKYDVFIEEDGILVPKPFLDGLKVLEFRRLSLFSDVSDDMIVKELKEFIAKYQLWINQQREIINKESVEHRIGYCNLDQCQKDCTRMAENVDLLLANNSTNIESFRLMNSAMFIQLWHSQKSTNDIIDCDFYKTVDDHLFGNTSAAWRPFQLAFILLNLDGIIQRDDDPDWKSRNELVDLVWFPTGGGKTEAYLGIIALSIIYRRKTFSKNGGGTSAIMRYTLRLLATQQFQRAMRLILALEQLRRWDLYALGDEAISIGLFVGDNSLPNKATDLLKECKKWNTIINGNRQESKIPLDRCPYCGEPLKYDNIGSETVPRIIFRCDNINCVFEDELPVKLCDEDIYTTPPTLLFGTVDKFAALGHRTSTQRPYQDSRRLFGKGGVNHLPPSLIIQDELHLLLGPLGSAVSLFECAIDQLCTYKTASGLMIRPKIISSTATTRNTDLQIRALYDRDVSIFPKPGTDYDDSFFSFYKRKKVNDQVEFVSKRKYIGILPTGRTHMTTQMRLVATMFVHRALFEKEYANQLTNKNVEETMDFYHSVLDYFNSLKEVGKTDAQFYTEFTKYTRRLFKRVLRYSNQLECLYCYDSSFSKSELTGRLSGSEVVDELKNVAVKWKADHRLPHFNQEEDKWERGTTPPDLILATNMISVGLDVSRFNTIIMNSMPRNVAEYIQASSRVARNKLGLVVTLHNPFRARDLSHFERFREFHEKLYYYVEPISITPFSKKSVNKYLPLYIATIIRHNYDQLTNVENAANLTLELQNKIKKDISHYFKHRLERTKDLPNGLSELLTDELEAFVEQFIEIALDKWQELVDQQQTEGFKLRYSGADYAQKYASRKGEQWKDLFLALDAYADEEEDSLWAVPMSLRTVETEAVLNVRD